MQICDAFDLDKQLSATKVGVEHFEPAEVRKILSNRLLDLARLSAVRVINAQVAKRRQEPRQLHRRRELLPDGGASEGGEVHVRLATLTGEVVDVYGIFAAHARGAADEQQV